MGIFWQAGYVWLQLKILDTFDQGAEHICAYDWLNYNHDLDELVIMTDDKPPKS